VHDPFISDPRFVSVEEAVEKSDVIILGAPHSAYRGLDFSSKQKGVDVWGFWRQK